MLKQLSFALTLLAVMVGCDNECDFYERCDGNVLQVCGDGVDQWIGRRIHETPCEEPSGACVELDDTAMCASEPLTECSLGETEAYCDGDVRYMCDGVRLFEPVDYPTAYLTAEDCADDGGTCDDSGEYPECVAADELD